MLLLCEEGSDEGLRVGTLCSSGGGRQVVLLLDLAHNLIHCVPLPFVLQLRAVQHACSAHNWGIDPGAIYAQHVYYCRVRPDCVLMACFGSLHS